MFKICWKNIININHCNISSCTLFCSYITQRNIRFKHDDMRVNHEISRSSWPSVLLLKYPWWSLPLHPLPLDPSTRPFPYPNERTHVSCPIRQLYLFNPLIRKSPPPLNPSILHGPPEKGPMGRRHPNLVQTWVDCIWTLCIDFNYIAN